MRLSNAGIVVFSIILVQGHGTGSVSSAVFFRRYNYFL